ncbi:hypothetical protein NPIL_320331 [Nephila pilipes]|uniref:Uncharacterized protein n=1 Tax=Nephila pilipes TaxID=299642 RepID=A0A8X6MP51_NEPPI|nr:hypothetical protein NPIL_320331 [Nephila pilipes]
MSSKRLIFKLSTEISLDDFIASALTDPRSQAMIPTNDPIPYLSASSDSPQPCSSKSLDVFIPDTSKSSNYVLPVDISPPSPKKAEVK